MNKICSETCKPSTGGWGHWLVCVTDVLASVPAGPTVEVQGWSSPGLASHLQRSFLRDLNTDMHVELHRGRCQQATAVELTSNLPALSPRTHLLLPQHLGFHLAVEGPSSFASLMLCPGVGVFAFCCSSSEFQKKPLSCIWQSCMGQVFIARKLFSKSSQTLTFDMGLQV